LKVGDVLPFRVPDNAEVSVNGFPVFKADIGSVGNQSAVKITETVMAGDDNE
jgi:flagellar motor switch protein FliM